MYRKLAQIFSLLLIKIIRFKKKILGENFYQFSCGNYKQIPYNRVQINPLSEMTDILNNNLIGKY